VNMNALKEWESFYVIVGSSAGALIGLQFVVLTLIADIKLRPGDAQAGGVFTTPSVIHFGVVLFLSAILSAPWKEVTSGSILWGVVGVGGVAYEIAISRRMRSKMSYKPVFEDWLFHVLLPSGAYTILAVGAFLAWSHVHQALFVVAGAALLLLFIGIHNAWDTVMYHVFVRRQDEKEAKS